MLESLGGIIGSAIYPTFTVEREHYDSSALKNVEEVSTMYIHGSY